MIFGAKLKNRRAKKKLLLPSLKMRVPSGSDSRRPRSISKKNRRIKKKCLCRYSKCGCQTEVAYAVLVRFPQKTGVILKKWLMSLFKMWVPNRSGSCRSRFNLLTKAGHQNRLPSESIASVFSVIKD